MVTPINSTPDSRDPLLEEVRAVKEAVSGRAGHDVARLCKELRQGAGAVQPSAHYFIKEKAVQKSKIMGKKGFRGTWEEVLGDGVVVVEGEVVFKPGIGVRFAKRRVGDESRKQNVEGRNGWQFGARSSNFEGNRT